MYRFLLNNTRNEAILFPDEEGPQELDSVNLTAALGSYQHLIKDWSFADNIILYQPYTIYYTVLDKYKALNFTTYNKEAHLV